MISGIFVTATGTGVGKTFFSCALAHFLTRCGVNVGALKPVASGARALRADGRKRWISDDALRLRRASGRRHPLDWVNPILYRHALAPYTAGYLEEPKFDLKKIDRAFSRVCRDSGFVIVEGIGGVCVPLTRRTEVADLMRRFRLPAVVVCEAGLGTLNPTLLTLRFLEQRKLPVSGIVLSRFQPQHPTHRTNLRFFKESGIRVLAALPVSRYDHPAVQSVLRRCAWARRLALEGLFPLT